MQLSRVLQPEIEETMESKKRLPTRSPAPRAVSQMMSECWSAHLMIDALWCGRRFRTFNVVDDFNREVLTIEVDFSLWATTGAHT